MGEKLLILINLMCVVVVVVLVKPEITFNKMIPTKFMWSNKPEKCQDSGLQVQCNGK